MSFIASGVYGYNRGKDSFGHKTSRYNDPYNEVCLRCGHIKFNHGDACYYTPWQFKHNTFESRDLGLEDLEYYFFKGHQYLSKRKL